VTLRRGPELPYKLIAGVTPCRPGWLVASAKLHGSTIGPETPRVMPTFLDVLSERPSFSLIVVNAPIGFPDSKESGSRSCDLQARALVGRRGGAVHSAPTRDVLSGRVPWYEGGLDVVSASLLPKYQEVAEEMSGYRQRTVYEGHPELSFYQINQDTPLKRSKKIVPGLDERRAVLIKQIPGIERILDATMSGAPVKHLYDATAMLWTARRVFGHAARRIPKEAEWDSEGLRMEIVY
jgi:predicted RNase H-like nuclease